MAKTINDYKNDYNAAKAAGDAAGMKAANDGANAIRASTGQATQSASQDIANVAASSSRSSSSSKSANDLPTYTGGNSELDSALQEWSDRYNEAKANGDAAGMRDANDEANKLRNEYGYGAEFAHDDITKTYYDNLGSGGGGGGGGGSYSGQSAQQSYIQDLSDYLNQMYAAQREAAISSIKNAYEQNLASIDRAKEQISPQYQAARNQTAGQSAQSARNFAEYASAYGLGSGSSAQAELARNTTLQNNLSQLNTEEANAYADLELQKSQAEIQYNNAIAEAEASNNAQLAAALYQEKVRVQDALTAQQAQIFQQNLAMQQLQFQQQQANIANQQWQQQFDTSNQQWQQQFQQDQLLNNSSLQDADFQRKLQAAQYLYELTGDASGLSILGYTPDQITALQNAYLAQMQPTSVSSSAGSSSGSSSSGSRGGSTSTQTSTPSAPTYTSGSTSSGNTSVNTQSQQATDEWSGIDKSSVTALGYGPISRAYLEALVDSGEVVAYQDPTTGLIKFRRADTGAGSLSGLYNNLPM